MDKAIRKLVDNAIGLPKILFRWTVIYSVDRRYPTFEQLYEAGALRPSPPRVWLLVMFLLHIINSTYLLLQS